MGFDFIVFPPVLLSQCRFFVFRCRISFLVGSSVFFLVDDCSADSCGFRVFVRSALMSLYFAILSAPPPFIL